jgi:hypothetical protein
MYFRKKEKETEIFIQFLFLLMVQGLVSQGSSKSCRLLSLILYHKEHIVKSSRIFSSLQFASTLLFQMDVHNQLRKPNKLAFNSQYASAFSTNLKQSIVILEAFMILSNLKNFLFRVSCKRLVLMLRVLFLELMK